MSEFVVRKMVADEIDYAIEWADKEGWNPGKYDGDCFYNADPDGYFVGVVDGKIVSMISAIKYGTNYGFIGFYIVDETCRGKGYGILTWNAAIHYLQGRLIGLDGVPEQVHNYKKSGFILDHRNITYKTQSRKVEYDTKGIVEVDINDFHRIKNYDLKFFPEPRDTFLKCWISQKDSKSLAYVEDNEIKAFGKIRKCKKAYKIGPLFSNDPKKAESLFSALQNSIPEGSDFTIDIPEPNLHAMKIAKKFNMEYAFESARMYMNGKPDIDLDKIYGITSYELG